MDPIDDLLITLPNTLSAREWLHIAAQRAEAGNWSGAAELFVALADEAHRLNKPIIEGIALVNLMLVHYLSGDDLGWAADYMRLSKISGPHGEVADAYMERMRDRDGVLTLILYDGVPLTLPASRPTPVGELTSAQIEAIVEAAQSRQQRRLSIMRHLEAINAAHGPVTNAFIAECLGVAPESDDPDILAVGALVRGASTTAVAAGRLTALRVFKLWCEFADTNMTTATIRQLLAWRAFSNAYLAGSGYGNLRFILGKALSTLYHNLQANHQITDDPWRVITGRGQAHDLTADHIMVLESAADTWEDREQDILNAFRVTHGNPSNLSDIARIDSLKPDFIPPEFVVRLLDTAGGIDDIDVSPVTTFLLEAPTHHAAATWLAAIRVFKFWCNINNTSMTTITVPQLLAWRAFSDAHFASRRGVEADPLSEVLHRLRRGLGQALPRFYSSLESQHVRDENPWRIINPRVPQVQVETL